MTTLSKWRPSQLGSFNSLREQFENMVKNVFDGDAESELSVGDFAWRPRMDVAETEEAYQVTVDLPGVDPEKVDISVTDNQLTVKGERSEEKETKDKTFHRVERSYGSFYRSVTLPTGCETDKIAASSSNGVINISIPKTKEAKAKTIKIKAK